jgi:hypothetical protein
MDKTIAGIWMKPGGSGNELWSKFWGSRFQRLEVFAGSAMFLVQKSMAW